MKKIIRLNVICIILLVISYPIIAYGQSDDKAFIEVYENHGASNIYIVVDDEFNYTLFCEKEQKTGIANQNTKTCPFCNEDIEELTKRVRQKIEDKKEINKEVLKYENSLKETKNNFWIRLLIGSGIAIVVAIVARIAIRR